MKSEVNSDETVVSRVKFTRKQPFEPDRRKNISADQRGNSLCAREILPALHRKKISFTDLPDHVHFGFTIPEEMSGTVPCVPERKRMMDSSYNSPVNGRTMPGAEPEYRRMDSIKTLLVELGSLCGQKTIHFLNSSVNYLEVGHWMRANGFYARNRTNRRRELFDQISARVAEKKVLYLEFGVASGASMRYWSRLLKNPASHLHGFDTFEGLPSDWRMGDK